MNLSLRLKLTFAFLTVALIPLAVLGFLNTHTTQQALTEAADEKLLNAATQTASSIDAFILTNLNIIRTEAQIPALANYLNKSPDQRQDDDLLKAEVFAILRSLSRKDPLNISAYKLLDRHGIDVLDTVTDSIGQNKREMDYFQQPIRNGLPFVSVVQFLPSDPSVFVLYFSSPVRSSNGEIIGVIAVEYQAAVLQNLIVQATGSTGAASFGVLFDEHQLRLAHGSAPHLLYTPATPLSSSLITNLQTNRRMPIELQPSFVYEFAGSSTYLKDPSVSPYFTLERTAIDNRPHRAAVATIQRKPWTVVFFQPEEILLAPVYAQSQTALWLGLLIAAPISGIAFLFAHALTRPIVTLTHIAKTITAGDLTVQADIDSQGEIGLLAQTFNAMTRQLRETLEGLEQHVVELQHTEEALRLSEAEARKLSLVASRTSNMVIITDSQRRIEWVNQAFTHITGYTLDEARGKFPGDLLYGPETDMETIQDMRSQLYNQQATLIENINYTKEGFPYWVEIDAQPICDESGQLTNIIALNRDITQRKQAEKELQFRNTILATQQETSPDGILVVNEKREWASFNQRFIDMWRIPVEVVKDGSSSVALQSVLKQVTHPEEFLAQIEYLYTHQTEKSYDEIEMVDGRVFDRYSGPMIGTDGTYYGRVWYYRDITDRKAFEKSLAEERNLLRTLIDNVPDYIYVKDCASRFVIANTALAQGVGVSTPEELIGKTDCDIFPPELAERYFSDEQSVILSGQPLINRVEPMLFIDAGKKGWASTTTVPFRDSHGQIVGLVGVSRDITENRKAEERQTRLLEELANVNEELKNFAYVVSHDLKAPLRSIGSLSGWLLSDYGDRLDEEGREMLNLLFGRVKRLDNLIEGILQYSRVGRVQEERVLVDLCRAVPAIIELLAPAEHIEVKIVDPLPSIYGEKTRIEQLFQNLLSNALKFMDKPQGKIEIGCMDVGGYWQFRISDNGPGIAPKYFDKVFQIFQTLASRDEIESSGIGLSLVKKIVEMHGGQIWIESIVGERTTFFFTLPHQQHLTDVEV